MATKEQRKQKQAEKNCKKLSIVEEFKKEVARTDELVDVVGDCLREITGEKTCFISNIMVIIVIVRQHGVKNAVKWLYEARSVYDPSFEEEYDCVYDNMEERLITEFLMIVKAEGM